MSVAIERYTTTITLTHLRQGAVRNLGCWSEPEIVVESFGHSRFWNHWRCFHRIDPASDLFNLADPTVLDQRDGS